VRAYAVPRNPAFIARMHPIFHRIDNLLKVRDVSRGGLDRLAAGRLERSRVPRPLSRRFHPLAQVRDEAWGVVISISLFNHRLNELGLLDPCQSSAFQIP
jgi:hypothetical protein